MSAIGEYIKLLPKGIANIDKIAESIVVSVKSSLKTLPEEEQNEIIRRRIICASCPFMSKNAVNNAEFRSLMGHNYKTSRKDNHCVLCGCNIDSKTRSLSSNCGIEAWNNSHPKQAMPLKWVKYK